MKGEPLKMKQAAMEGQMAGAWLIERAPHVLLFEYSNREPERRSEASKRFDAAMEQLKTALNARADEPAISQALHAIDGAVWDVAVEHEDRAWHAAWTLATQLAGGAPHAPIAIKK